MIALNGMALGTGEEVAELDLEIQAALALPPTELDIAKAATILARFPLSRVERFSTFRGNVPVDFTGWLLELTGNARIVFVQEVASLRTWLLVRNDPNIFGADAEIQA